MATQEVTVTPTVQSVSIASGIPQQAIDPTREMYLYSDFIADVSPFGATTGSAINPSSAVITFDSSTAQSVYGYASIAVDGEASARGGIFTAPSSTTQTLRNVQVGQGAWEFIARVQFNSASATTQRVLVGLGISHAPAGSTMLQYGAAFTAFGNQGNWQASVADNNVVTDVDTGVSSASWNTLRITVNAAGNEFKFYANGVLVRTFSGTAWDYANNLVNWGVECRDKAAGGTGTTAILLVDYMAVRYTIAR
jgi:hypothetical protein